MMMLFKNKKNLDLEAGNATPLINGNLIRSKSFRTLPRRPQVGLSFENLQLKVLVNHRNKVYKTLLNDVSGSFDSGQLIALMGPSGAGKTTLMNSLAAYKIQNVTGEIKVNGKSRNLRTFRKSCCYIMQDDKLLSNLTVLECMIVSANLKLTEKKTFDEKLTMINEILATLKLTDHKNTKTDNLSGGQRKRLCIAQELINNPPLMFFDEPTSGLDSQSSYQCIYFLKSLVKDGRTIICTIHQPSAKLFELFDKVFILAAGECIYNGTVPALLPYLKSHGLSCPAFHNQADFAIEVAGGGEYGDVNNRLAQAVRSGACEEFVSEYTRLREGENQEVQNKLRKQQQRNSAQYGDFLPKSGKIRAHAAGFNNINNTDKKALLPIKSKLVPSKLLPRVVQNNENEDDESVSITPSSENKSINSASAKSPRLCDWRFFAAMPCQKFSVLFLRTFKCIIRDKNLSLLRLISHIIVGLLIGGLYFNIGNDATKKHSNMSFLFLSMLFLMFTSLMPTVMTFPLEMAVFIREHLNYWYSLPSYYFAKTLADLPFQIVFPMVYSTIVYWMTGQPNDAKRFLLFLLLSVLVSLVAQSLGLLIGAAASIQVAVFLGPITAIPILLFSGFFVKLVDMHISLRWISYFSYVRYAYEGTLLSIYGSDRGLMNCGNLIANVECPISTNPKMVLQQMELTDDKLWIDMAILIVFFLVFRFACFLVLLWRIWRKN